jgi:hypothetical protein
MSTIVGTRTSLSNLNTTHVDGLDVPIDPERFNELKHMLTSRVGLTSVQVYNWLCFWIFQIIPKIPKIYEMYDIDSSTPCFFMYRRVYDKIRTPSALMIFLFTFIKNNIPFNYIDHTSCFKKHSSHEVRLSTFQGLVEWSFEVYKRGDFIVGCSTSPLERDHLQSVFTSSSDPQYDHFQVKIKKAFHTCLEEIRDEVAFRPGNVSMLSARDDFYSSLYLCRV